MTTSCVTIDIVQDSIIEIREEFRVEIFSEEDSVVIANASSSSIVFIDGEIGKLKRRKRVKWGGRNRDKPVRPWPKIGRGQYEKSLWRNHFSVSAIPLYVYG